MTPQIAERWSIAVDGRTFGPYSDDVLKRMLAASQVLPTTLAWCPGATGWAPIQTYTEFRATPPPVLSVSLPGAPPLPPYSSNALSSTPAPPTPFVPATRGPVPVPVRFAAVLSFAWAGLFGLIVLDQMVSAATGEQAGSALLAIWNALIVFVYVFIGIGLWKGERKAYEFGVGSNALNIGIGFFWIFAFNGMAGVFLIPLEITILVILLLHRQYFSAQ